MTENNASQTNKINPFSSKHSSSKPTVSKSNKVNPFKTKSVLEDATPGIRYEIFERTSELSERKRKSGNDKE